MELQKKDILKVAKELNIEVSDRRVEKILEEYPETAEDYPEENWDYIVEDMLYNTETKKYKTNCGICQREFMTEENTANEGICFECRCI